MAKGVKRSAYERFSTGKTELKDFTVSELYEIVEALVNENASLKEELKEVKKSKVVKEVVKETPKTIRLDEEDYNLLQSIIVKKVKRVK